MFYKILLYLIVLNIGILYIGYLMSKNLSVIFSSIRTIEQSQRYDPYLFIETRTMLCKLETVPVLLLFVLVLLRLLTDSVLTQAVLAVLMYVIGASIDVFSTIYALYYGSKQGFRIIEINPVLLFVNLFKRHLRALKVIFFTIEIIVICTISLLVSISIFSGMESVWLLLCGMIGVLRMMAGTHNLRLYLILLETKLLETRTENEKSERTSS